MRTDDPLGRAPPAIRRTVTGAIDTDYYDRRARAARAEFLRAVFACIARCGWRAWGCIKARMAGQAAREELSALSTRELKDLGLAHSDIEALASGTYHTDPTRCARSRERARRCA
jgi:uncharacterized protein YjiS (DUF1127 family)